MLSSTYRHAKSRWVAPRNKEKSRCARPTFSPSLLDIREVKGRHGVALQRVALQEVKQIACWLPDWADGGDEFGENLRALGDLNIDRNDDPLYQAFVATGLRPPTKLESLPRTIFQDPDEGHFYDQIAWFVDANGNSTLTEPLRYEDLAGNFDFRPALQGALTTTQLRWRISDHYALWASFSVRPA